MMIEEVLGQVIEDGADAGEPDAPVEPEAAPAPAPAPEAAAEPKAKPKASRAPKPAKGRALGPVDDQPAAADLLVLLACADSVEVAFVADGKDAIGLDPVLVQGDAWRNTGSGVVLTLADLAVSPNGNAPVRVEGYALLLDGKQVAFRQRFEPLVLTPATRFNLAGDVIF